jgi:hypothetical protein
MVEVAATLICILTAGIALSWMWLKVETALAKEQNANGPEE